MENIPKELNVKVYVMTIKKEILNKQLDKQLQA